MIHESLMKCDRLRLPRGKPAHGHQQKLRPCDQSFSAGDRRLEPAAFRSETFGPGLDLKRSPRLRNICDGRMFDLCEDKIFLVITFRADQKTAGLRHHFHEKNF